MIYLDNAATTLRKPEQVIRAVCDAMGYLGNEGRGVNEGSLSAGRVVYGARDPEKGCCGSVYRIAEDADLGNDCPCRGGVREEECRALLERFFETARGKAQNASFT